MKKTKGENSKKKKKLKIDQEQGYLKKGREQSLHNNSHLKSTERKTILQSLGENTEPMTSWQKGNSLVESLFQAKPLAT